MPASSAQARRTSARGRRRSCRAGSGRTRHRSDGLHDAGGQFGPPDPGDPAEHGITDLVTGAVVDGLELVEGAGRGWRTTPTARQPERSRSPTRVGRGRAHSPTGPAAGRRRRAQRRPPRPGGALFDRFSRWAAPDLPGTGIQTLMSTTPAAVFFSRSGARAGFTAALECLGRPGAQCRPTARASCCAVAHELRTHHATVTGRGGSPDGARRSLRCALAPVSRRLGMVTQQRRETPRAIRRCFVRSRWQRQPGGSPRRGHRPEREGDRQP
jgi:hypothetical protein